MDSILLETSFHWFSDDIVRFKIEVGLRDMCKNVTVVTPNLLAVPMHVLKYRGHMAKPAEMAQPIEVQC